MVVLGGDGGGFVVDGVILVVMVMFVMTVDIRFILCASSELRHFTLK